MLCYNFIETPIFQRLIDELLSAEEYQKFQAYLLLDPDVGSTIAHTGGCRKIRWALPAKGKSGGIRVIYYYIAKDGEIHLLYAYPKSEQENLTDKQKAVMKHYAQQIEAEKMKDEMFDELIESMKQTVAIRRGDNEPSRVTSYAIPDVKAIRASVGMKQNEFAQAVGVSPSLVQSWEQHKRVPNGSNLKMLRVIEKHPDVLQMFIQA